MMFKYSDIYSNIPAEKDIPREICKNVITLAVTNRWRLGSMGTSNLFKMKK